MQPDGDRILGRSLADLERLDLGDDVIPAQCSRLLGPQPRQQGQDDVRLQPRPLGRSHQRNRLLQCQRLRRPPAHLPFGGSTSAATFRPTRSSRSARRIARTSTLCAICTVRVDTRDAIAVSASCTSTAVSSVSRTLPSSSRSAFAIVPRYNVTVRADSPSRPRQPVLERVPHGVPPPRPQPALHLLMQVPQLVPDLGLGPADDLLAIRVPAGLNPRLTAPMYRFLIRPSRSSPRPARDACLWLASWEPPCSEWLPFWLPPPREDPE